MLRTIAEVGTDVGDWTYVFLESDSYDESPDLLREFDGQHSLGIVRSYGDLRHRYPEPVDRRAFLRNACLRLLEDAQGLDRFPYTIVLDLGAANADLQGERLLAVLHEQHATWAGIFANQSRRYYDVWSLRHPKWSPDDCWARVRNRPAGMSEREARRTFVRSRQILIPPEAERIEVDSAFGGLAVYRSSLLEGCAYSSRADDGHPVSEHLSVHEDIRSRGGRLFIDPALVNCTGMHPDRFDGVRRLRYGLRSLAKRLRPGDEADEPTGV